MEIQDQEQVTSLYRFHTKEEISLKSLLQQLWLVNYYSSK